ncbi:tRNA pseudouridine(55) synthase TruB [Stakelama tenebrarum]|uniref:tRNA pseudouridine synthase B n=1 Tax=Stakelama tenebrarum TaxID=2711215 RepID=A0A6G6Y2L8_9SPHN|nr:tRNA pseudouridine(55) synthase TruB [Sphingosinithalassobacter tenebrarum]QIG78816.1 tRNA pseudouridine(55) synthase TruB [Sphingosinithalassobacter tenebrarum]
MHGWIILDKPLGLGSTQGVSAVKRALREAGYGPKKKDMPKVGHGGTLDPLATGVLPVAIGEATKLAGRMLDSDKVYDFTIRFGVETDTLDCEGKEIATSEMIPTRDQVAAVLPRFTGPIEQVPPAYSALKVDGARAYDLARAGEEVVLETRSVTVHSLKILPELASGRGTREAGGGAATSAAVAPPPPPPRDCVARSPSPSELGEECHEITLTAHVSKGTYIRSLARDIARAVGSVGHVTYLRRTKAGPFGLEQAISLDKLADAAKERRLEELLLPLRAGLDDIPALSLTPDQAGRLRAGQQVIGTTADDGLVFAMLDDVPVALAEVQAGNVRVVRGFNL